MRYAAIDYGLERTGLAISDADGRLAFPRATLRLSDYGSRHRMLNALAHEIEAAGACAVVIGLPLLDDGSESLTCRQIRNMATRLARRLPLPLYFVNEALTSQEALEDVRRCGRYGQRARAVLDQQAAVRILESFLSLPWDARARLRCIATPTTPS